ncbi:MAG TPA: NAD-dependent epimerase/dehydratase family protein [Longimicrobiales bacterium]|nr:NAD-dependent epimerase/dehydratase family protein [Longimicrobiales bacterium]
MRYFLTGATGFIGGRVARQLRDAGHEVVALVRDPAATADLAALGVELAAGDILETETLRSPMRGADGVFHLAAWYRLGARDRGRARAINVDGTRNVLEAARGAGVPRVVYTSSLAVFGDTGGRVVDESYRMAGPWLSEYDRTKWLAHYEVALPMIEAGLPLIILQPGLVHGPGDHSNVGAALRDYLRGRLPATPDQGGCWSLVDDTARAHLLAMERGRPGATYIIGGPPRMWKDILALAEEITGIRAPRFVLPAPVARLASAVMKPVAAVAPLPPMYHPETLRVAAGSTYFGDDARARREIGWDPRPLRDALEITLAAERRALGL